MNKPVALNENDILHILQNANSVPLGQPIWESTEEYNKLKAIIESAIAYTHTVKELTDEDVAKIYLSIRGGVCNLNFLKIFAKECIRKAQE